MNRMLKVITVVTPGLDGLEHTAYTVMSFDEGRIEASSGWTLRDAIEYFARDYG